MSLVFVSVGFMAFFAATTLAIDVGLMMTARAQAQNSADAAALAGATAFVYNSFADRSAGGPAVQSAINTAKREVIIQNPYFAPDDGVCELLTMMVKRGAAWFYPEFARSEALYDVEQQARDAQRGLWALPLQDRIEPWEWRKRAARRN